MATWLHDIEVYTSLVEGEAGPARDWGTTRVALFAPERFSLFPEDERSHNVVFAAGPPTTVDVLFEALASRRPCPAGLANAAAALGAYGLLPEDTGPWVTSLRGALREDGDEADMWLAYALSKVGGADGQVLKAAARVTAPMNEWLLSTVVLRVAEHAGALDDAAVVIAAEFARVPDRGLDLLIAVLMGLGVLAPLLATGRPELEFAIQYGSVLAHAPPPTLRLPPGSLRRREQYAIRELLEGVPGAAAALLRAVARDDLPPGWGVWLASIAAWLRGRAIGADHETDAVHDVLHHVAGADSKVLSAARRSVGPQHKDDILGALRHVPELGTEALAGTLLRASQSIDLADALLDAHGGDQRVNISTAAFTCVAGHARPDAVPELLASDSTKRRALGLLCAEFVPTSEVLAALLAMPVPAGPVLRLQYARDLAAMADSAVLPHLKALVAGDKEDALAEPRKLAESLLKVEIK